ncbi:MAG: MBL fold metallo-hydrolase [Candidatus Omnitrophota bacterium]
MEILFLGTAAAEGWPGLFCECRYCQRARRLKGKDIRSRSSLLIDGRYKVDFPPDTYWQMNRYNIRLAKVKHLFVTHDHSDHYCPLDLRLRAAPFAHLGKEDILNIYTSKSVCDSTLKAQHRGDYEKSTGISFHIIEPYKEFTAGEMKVLPVKADHDPKKLCFNFVFRYKGRTLLHGHDTGWYPEETWKALQDFKFDLIVLDCTNGKIDEERYHLGIKGVMKVKKRLAGNGNLKKSCRCVATHFSHNGGLLHAELEKILGKEGIEVAYDGKVVKI